MTGMKNIIEDERKILQQKADAYYEEWKVLTGELGQKSQKIGKNLLLVLLIGASLIYLFQLLKRPEDKQKAGNPVKKQSSRIGSLMTSLLLPILISTLKNIILPEKDIHDE